MKAFHKKHKLFLIQIGLGVVCFVIVAYLTNRSFYNNAKVNSYIAINDGVKAMAGSTSDLLDSLIIKNEVTFDPTSGKELEKVFTNLKQRGENKFLMIGSSQLRVVQGEEGISGLNKIVSKEMEANSNQKFQTYNLSIGGMKTKEKIIIAKKATEILKFNNILVSVTPWDCLVDEIRPGVSVLQNQTFTPQKKFNAVDKKLKKEEIFPLNLNNDISRQLERALEEYITIYSKRTGIKQWLNDEAVSIFTKRGDSLTSNGMQPMADYWLTLNQDLDNKSGWDTKTANTGKRALKIINSQKTASKWQGELIFLKAPTDTFEFEGWSKADSVSTSTKLYAIDYQVTFVDNTTQWYFRKLRFNKGTHDWEQVKTEVTFDKKVKAIKPHLLFYGGTGTVWFDDIKAFPIIDGIKQDNIMPNPGAELELKERLNLSYSYNKEEWNKIKENMFSVVDYLKSNEAQNKYLLLTPFWHTDKKSAYPQKDQYASLVEQVKAYCIKNNVKCIDASYILNKENFGVYTNGSVRDKIDVLHFDAQAHEVLAKYIIKNL